MTKFFIRALWIGLFGGALVWTACSSSDNTSQQQAQHTEWIQLFNGKSLDGWTPKFTGHELGTNYKNTFRVEDSLLTVSYDEYDQFDNTFGHLFYSNQSFSHYKIRAEYRFIGEQVEGGEAWAFRNNGLMLLSQPPETMGLNQDFPVSLEVQLLGGNGSEPRSTANLCTPGTNVKMNGELILQHCTNSTSKTFAGDQWVTVEAEIRGNRVVHHIVEGDTVLTYSNPQYDDRNPDSQKLIKKFNRTLIDSGYIAIQAESHPTQFRKIEVLPLDD